MSDYATAQGYGTFGMSNKGGGFFVGLHTGLSYNTVRIPAIRKEGVIGYWIAVEVSGNEVDRTRMNIEASTGEHKIMTTISSQTDYATQEAVVHMNRISKTSRNLGITLSTNYNKAMHVTDNTKIKIYEVLA